MLHEKRDCSALCLQHLLAPKTKGTAMIIRKYARVLGLGLFVCFRISWIEFDAPGFYKMVPERRLRNRLIIVCVFFRCNRREERRMTSNQATERERYRRKEGDGVCVCGGEHLFQRK